MKVLITGDWHIKEKSVLGRKDVWEVTKNKLEFIFHTAEKEGAKYILQPGDMFDSWRPSFFVISEIVKLLKRYQSIKVLTVPGQHDLRYHYTSHNTPIGFLDDLWFVEIVTEPIEFASKDVVVYGAGWREEIVNPNTEGINILLTHRMVIDEKLWEKQSEYERSSVLLRKYNYDIIVCGDNHTEFHTEFEGRYLFNCGSLVRSKRNEEEHLPVVWIVDLDTKEKKRIEVPKAPFLFSDLRSGDKEDRLQSLIEELKSTRSVSLNFMEEFLNRTDKHLTKTGKDILEKEILV